MEDTWGPSWLFSDIHADMGALDAILRLSQSGDFIGRYGPVSLAINMGDVLERGHSPEQVVERLESISGLESILGNHDEAFLSRISVSGSDAESERVHEEYRATGRYEGFFRGMGKYYVNTKEKLYVVHGGPSTRAPSRRGRGGHRGVAVHSALAAHLALRGAVPRRQRLSLTCRGRVRRGEERLRHGVPHRLRPRAQEAAYVQKGGAVEDVLQRLEKATLYIGGREVREKKLPLEEDACYLARLGMAGPEGYGEYEDRRCFGVYTRKGGRALYLLSFGK